MSEQSEAKRSKKLLLGLFEVEWLGIVSVLLMVVLYELFGLRERLYSGERTLWVYYREALRAILYLYPLILFGAYLYSLVKEGAAAKRRGEKLPESELWRKFRSDFLNVSKIFRDVRLIHAVSIILFTFLYLKHLVPNVNSGLYDQFLYELESAVFGESLFALSGPDWLLLLLEVTYTAFYAYLSLIVFFFAVQSRELLAREFMLAYGLLWILGVLWVYLTPTWGPCFFVPEYFAAMPENSMQSIQAELWQNRLTLLKEPLNTEYVFSISGIPSLHFALTVLGSLYLMQVSKVLAALSWTFALLTFLATLVFGWHYLTDDLASLVLVVLAISLARICVCSGKATSFVEVK